MNAVHFALDKCLAVNREKAFVIPYLHSLRIIGKFGLHLSELTHLKAALYAFD